MKLSIGKILLTIGALEFLDPVLWNIGYTRYEYMGCRLAISYIGLARWSVQFIFDLVAATLPLREIIFSGAFAESNHCYDLDISSIAIFGVPAKFFTS